MTPATLPRSVDSPESPRTAFRDLHATRLHGFALLLTLGDARRAAELTNAALAEAADHIEDLRHPVRAAAWLRHRVLRSAGRRQPARAARDRLAALEPLGIDGAVLAGIAALGTRERAGLIAATVERFADLDVGVVVGAQGDRLHALLRRARGRYLEAAARAEPGFADDGQGGPTTSAVRAVAKRAMT